MSTSDLNAFQHWVADLAKGAGIELPTPLNPLGLELEMESRLAWVMPHRDAGLAVVGMIDPTVAALRAQESAGDVDDLADHGAPGSTGFIRA
jgi:hypothetical protein